MKRKRGKHSLNYLCVNVKVIDTLDAFQFTIEMSSPCIAITSYMDFECIAMETTFLVRWSASRVCINAVIIAKFKRLLGLMTTLHKLDVV